MDDAAVITVTDTVLDGTVVHWFRTAGDPLAVCSASSRGVVVHTHYLTQIPPSWVEQARAAHGILARDPRADLGRLATHVYRQVEGRSEPVWVPITRTEQP